MIIDKIKNSAFYFGLDSKIDKGLNFLNDNDLLKMESGKVMIEEDKIFAIIQEYNTIDKSTGKWEAHRKYIDIQYAVEGCEMIGYTNLEGLEVTEKYDPDKDVGFYNGKGDFFLLEPGTFAIFTPEDAHMPGISSGKTSKVKKIVVKIMVE